MELVKERPSSQNVFTSYGTLPQNMARVPSGVAWVAGTQGKARIAPPAPKQAAPRPEESTDILTLELGMRHVEENPEHP